MDTSALDKLIQRCGYPGSQGRHPLNARSLTPFLQHATREEFCNAFSKRVAEEYVAGRLTFSVADSAMNRLWEYAFLGDESFIPAYSREVFEAFDEGEYAHREDAPGTDPRLRYTLPSILELVARG
jgi:hypothetical protein